MTAVALALVASLAWGIGDFLGGTAARRLATLTVLAVSQPAGLLLVAALVAADGEPFFGARATAFAAAAGIGGAVGLAALYRGMAVGAIGVVAPISAAAAVVPLAVGLARGERPGAVQLAGVALVLSGVVLVSRERGEGVARFAAGVPLALLAAGGFGSYYVLIDEAAAADPFWAVLVGRGVSSALAVAVALSRGALVPPAGRLPVLLLIGVFDVGANAALAVALNEGLISLVSVLASLYPVVTILLARVVLAERVERPQAAGIAGALAGVALISAG